MSEVTFERSIEIPLMQDKIRLGVLLFLASEAVFFAFLIVAYVYSQPSEIQGPTAHSSLIPWKTGLYTLALFSSSGTIYFAEQALDHDERRTLGWLAATIFLGAVFLFGEMREYSSLLHKDITISRNLFGSTYFTLTGFHAIHVTIGLLMLLALLALLFTRKLGPNRRTSFKAISYYWHFVDIVWVAVFSTVYLWSAR